MQIIRLYVAMPNFSNVGVDNWMWNFTPNEEYSICEINIVTSWKILWIIAIGESKAIG
jgi:hypothetical protein